MNKVIHRRYIAALKYIFIATSLIAALIIVIQKGKNKMTRKIQLEYQIHKQENEKIILLDVKNTFKNIFDMLKKKHPNIKIELVNE